MSISSETRIAGPFTGTGLVSTYSFTFKVFSDDDIMVVEADTDNAETTLVLNTDYTVSLNADQDVSPGGSITLSAPLATNYKLVITSAVENLQPLDLTNAGGFYPTVINDALDRACIQIQQLQELVDRSVKIPITSSDNPTNYLAEANAAMVGAQAAQAGAELALDEFTDLYLGAKDSDPIADNDGNALQEGAIYFNTLELVMKVYSITTGWLVAQSAVPITITTQLFSGTGSQTDFTLSAAPAFLSALEVVVGGVPQIPTLNYTLSGATLTFTSAPPSGTNNIFCRWFSSMTAGVPNDGSVTEAKLSLSDNASYDVTTARHGFAPKLPNDSSKFLNGVGGYTTIPPASETVSGIIELATAAEALDGIDKERAVTSAGLASAKLLSTNGYQKLPGGLIIQWGRATTSSGWNTITTFPITFPSACMAVVVTPDVQTSPTGAGISDMIGVKYRQTSGFYGGTYAIGYFVWIAIGY